MTTKTLYILISDNGDGSYSPCFTFDDAAIQRQQERYDAGEIDYTDGAGVDGDGFHYTTLTVPVDCTYESLGISKWSIFTVEDELEG